MIDERDEDDETIQGGDEDDDANMQIDMGAVQGGGFVVYPKAWYNVTVDKCEFKRSDSSNKPMFQLALEIDDGEFAGKKIPAFLSLSEAALPMTKGALAVLHPEMAKSKWNPMDVADQGLLLGRKASILLGIKRYEGENRNQIKRWKAPAAGNEFIAGA